MNIGKENLNITSTQSTHTPTNQKEIENSQNTLNTTRTSEGSKSLETQISQGIRDLSDAVNIAGGSVLKSIKSFVEAGKNELDFMKYVLTNKKLPDNSSSLSHKLLNTGMLKEFASSISSNYKNYPTQISDAYHSIKAGLANNVKNDFLAHLGEAIPVARTMIDRGIAALSPKVPPAVGDETSTRGGLQGRGKYETIEKKFTSKDGTEIGKEQVLRINTITQRKESLEAKIDYLSNKLVKGGITNPNELKLINQQLKQAKEQLNVCKNSKNDWMGSNDSRDILVGKSVIEGRKNNIPVAVNQRTQTVTTKLPFGEGEKTLSMQRFGAIWDQRNGLNNLKELQSYANEFKASGNDANSPAGIILNAKLDARKAELEGMRMKYNSDDQLFIIGECVRTLEAFRPGTGKLEEQNLVLNDRKNYLRDQALEPIKLQLQNNSHLLTKDENDGSTIFRMMHMGLLNQNAADDFQNSGWAHFEGNQILDMQAAFESIDNLEIQVRDERGTFFDDTVDGKTILYVCASEVGWKDNMPKELKLETCFMNLSVQGHTTNDGIQAEVNKKEMAKLGSWLPQNKEVLAKFNELNNRLEIEKESSFELAADIALFASSVSAMSEGCLSCKDRGGTLAEIIAIKSMETNLKDYHKIGGTDHQQALKDIDDTMRKFSNEIFEEDGPVVKVVNDCTGVKVAKVDFRELKRMDPINRIKELGKVAFAALTGGLEVTQQEYA